MKRSIDMMNRKVGKSFLADFSFLFGSECYYGILLRRASRGNYSGYKREYHTDHYEYDRSLPGKYCPDVIKSRKVLDYCRDRYAE